MSSQQKFSVNDFTRSMKWLSLLLLLNVANAFIANGVATLDSSKGLDHIGFDFKSGSVVGNEGDLYYYEGDLWTNHVSAGFKDMGADLIDSIETCDLQGYENDLKPVKGHVYCIKTIEGSYAKIRISELTSTKLIFEWNHQRDGTNLFTTKEETMSNKIDINWSLIGIIGLLLIIIFLLWKYR